MEKKRLPFKLEKKSKIKCFGSYNLSHNKDHGPMSIILMMGVTVNAVFRIFND